MDPADARDFCLWLDGFLSAIAVAEVDLDSDHVAEVVARLKQVDVTIPVAREVDTPDILKAFRPFVEAGVALLKAELPGIVEDLRKEIRRYKDELPPG